MPAASAPPANPFTRPAKAASSPSPKPGRELARRGVTLNVVCPGPTDTPLLASIAQSSPKLTDALARAIPLGRLGHVDDYPGMIAFLLSDDAAFITGQAISVSGGLTMS